MLHHCRCYSSIDSFYSLLRTFQKRYNQNYSANYYEVNYPSDSNGHTCFYDHQDAPYIYFSNPNDVTTGRYCVSTCPGYGEALQCSAADKDYCSKFAKSEYGTYNTVNRLGAFCMPKDQSVADHLWNSPQL